MSAPPGRSWGFWSEIKLGILQEYLRSFLTASKDRADEFVYLDAFAGESLGLSRLTGDAIPGSARLALEIDIAGGFTKLRYFEQPSKATQLQRELCADHPYRDIVVYPGDCNETIPLALKELQAVRWAPTFAFIDPDGMELSWTTLVSLAEHKRGFSSFKVELWLLFPTQGLIRVLAHDDKRLLLSHEQQATRLFGTESWRSIYERRRSEQLSAPEAKEEYVNLMRWRLVHDLGYAKTHAFEMKNSVAGTLYHMIFATDHPAGDQIMAHLYTKAAKDMPEMQRQARDRQSGQMALEVSAGILEATYEYQPPWKPT